MKLSEAEAPIRAALERLAESPLELRCFVIIQEPLTKRFVQFCTPPPSSLFDGSSRICCNENEPLIFDGWGDGKDGGYRLLQKCVDVLTGTIGALHVLNSLLPKDAEIHIVEESTRMDRPS